MASEEHDVAAAIHRNFNERGRRLLRDAEACFTLDVIAQWGFHSTREYIVDGASIAEVEQR